ncbi:MAG: exodeoxyribonuclease VII small subunit [Candidatus Humimicrobiaceae bacterium]
MGIDKLSFEEAMNKLEEVVKDLEDETISLDSAMEKFESGVKLSELCLKKLNEAEKKIEELTRSENGELKIIAVDLKENEGDLKN